jgi:hypothetical protein
MDWYMDGMNFSTYDRDNDESPGLNCAMGRGGAMWYNRCFYGCLTCGYANSQWDTLPTDWYIKASRMLMKAN